jgi:hypothetical protein
MVWHRGLMRCDVQPVAERFAVLLQRLGTTFVKCTSGYAPTCCPRKPRPADADGVTPPWPRTAQA